MASSAHIQLFPLLKGEDYEDVESNVVNGCYRAGSSKDSKGGPRGLLPFCRLLRFVFRLQIKADNYEQERRRLVFAPVSFYGCEFPCHVEGLDMLHYFCNYRNMTSATEKDTEQVAKFAAMFSAMGTEARLRIMQLLLSAHPDGMVVGELQQELDIPNSTLSHHLDKLRNEGLVQVRRESTFLRYTANTEALQEVLRFLYAECCTRNKAVEPRDVIQICK
jgi:ArsR family transcriptional regulator, arsenate/arsenite/antimonite-responsive transcriptional repressor